MKWSGLGMGLFSTTDTSLFDGYVDILLANGFTELRIDMPDYQNTVWLERSKAAVIRAVAKGAKVIWGVSSNAYNNTDYTITAENWSTFRQAILDNAQWAQDNGVYEFQLGNEEEYHNDNTTLTDAQLIVNLKSVAIDVQAIFTNGNVSYSCSHSNIDNWVTAGKGDIDILASNVYRGGTTFNDNWKTEITNLMNAFGAEHTYLTEFGPSYTSLDDYSTDEAVQATAVTEMIDYLKASGMTRAFYFYYISDNFGARKANGTYRLLWNSLKGEIMSNLFADGFESGDLTKWSSAVTDGGNLSASAAAKIHGVYGLSCLINDTTAIYVQDNTPASEKRYRCRFYLDPNDLAMANSDEFPVLKSFNTALTVTQFLISLRYTSAGGYDLCVITYKDDSSVVQTSKYAITNTSHCVEIDWKASSAAETNDGTCELIIDGVSKQTLTGLDTDTEVIDLIRLGAVTWIDAGTSGTLFLDDFASNNDGNLIGTINKSSMVVID